MKLNVEIGQNIVSKRKQLGLTQEKLALEANISISYLRRIEHGTANPTINQLERIVAPMGITLKNLMTNRAEN